MVSLDWTIDSPSEPRIDFSVATSYFSAALTSAAAASSGLANCCPGTDGALAAASELFASPHPTRMPSIVAAQGQPAMRRVAALLVVALLLLRVRGRRTHRRGRPCWMLHVNCFLGHSHRRSRASRH